MRLGVHLLASQQGYRTRAASPDVTGEEQRALEALVYGQSNDPDFLRSLEREPAVLVRPLPSGRCAITRLFQGSPDDAGRATLDMRTLLCPLPDYEHLVRGDLEQILQRPELWARERFEEARVLALAHPPRSAPPTIGPRTLRLVDAYLDALDHKRPTVLLPDSEAHRRDLINLVRVLASEDLAQVRWGLRVLSLAGDPDLVTGVGAVDRSRRTILMPDLETPPAHEIVHFLAVNAAAIRVLPPIAKLRGGELLKWMLTVQNEPASDERAVPAPGASTIFESAPHRRVTRSSGKVMALSIAAAVIITGVCLGLVITLLFLRDARDSVPPGQQAAPQASTDEGSEPEAIVQSRESLRARALSRPATRSSGGTAAPVASPSPTPSVLPPPESRPPDGAAPPEQPALPSGAPASTPAPVSKPSTPPAGAPQPDDSREPATPQTPSAKALAVIEAERRQIAAQMGALVEQVAQLQKALQLAASSGSASRWDAARCTRVLEAIDRVDRVLSRSPLVFFEEELKPWSRTPPPVFSDLDDFLAQIPALVAALDATTALTSEDGLNALVTRRNAIDAAGRATCAGPLSAPIRESTQRFQRTINPFVPIDDLRRLNRERAASTQERFRRGIREGLRRFADDLDTDLRDALRAAAAAP